MNHRGLSLHWYAILLVVSKFSIGSKVTYHGCGGGHRKGIVGNYTLESKYPVNIKHMFLSVES